MADTRADIEEAAGKFLKAVNTKDLEALAKLYMDDCRIMIPGTPVKFGPDAIVEDMTGWFKNGVDRIAFTTEDCGGSGDQAWRRGNFTTYTKDNKIFTTGKDINIYKRVGGKLFAFIDIWNFDSAQ